MTIKQLQPDGIPKYESYAGRSADVARSGKMGWAMMWLLGIPLPILLILYLIIG